MDVGVGTVERQRLESHLPEAAVEAVEPLFGGDPKAIAPVYDEPHEASPRQVGVDGRLETLSCGIVDHHAARIAYEDASATVLRQIVAVAGFAHERHTDEVVLVGSAAHAVEAGGPQAVLTVDKNVANLVVGQPRAVVVAEVLLVLVAVKLVESSESGDPDVAFAVFGKGVDMVVGDGFGYQRIAFHLPVALL